MSYFWMYHRNKVKINKTQDQSKDSQNIWTEGELFFGLLSKFKYFLMNAGLGRVINNNSNNNNDNSNNNDNNWNLYSAISIHKIFKSAAHCHSLNQSQQRLSGRAWKGVFWDTSWRPDMMYNPPGVVEAHSIISVHLLYGESMISKF